jgi:hypothetical protein
MAVLYFKSANGFNKKNTVCDVILTSSGNADQYTLPADVIITINGSKLISQSQILDGVAVFERVTRKPCDINLDFTLRQVTTEENTVSSFGKTQTISQTSKWVFPMDEINYFFQKIWVKDSVLKIDNDLINNIGIYNVIVDSFDLATIRGNVDVPVKLKCFEDFYSVNTQGQSLLI